MKHFILAFLIAGICYFVFYSRIEHRRVKKGPWEVAFTNDTSGAPMLLINQPSLAITNVHLNFPDQQLPATNGSPTFRFADAKPVPFDVPFGKCIFLDTTFLPGTVTLQLFGHEIELLPRALIIDRQEHPWLSESTNTLHAAPDPIQTTSHH